MYIDQLYRDHLNEFVPLPAPSAMARQPQSLAARASIAPAAVPPAPSSRHSRLQPSVRRSPDILALDESVSPLVRIKRERSPSRPRGSSLRSRSPRRRSGSPRARPQPYRERSPLRAPGDAHSRSFPSLNTARQVSAGTQTDVQEAEDPLAKFASQSSVQQMVCAIIFHIMTSY